MYASESGACLNLRTLIIMNKTLKEMLVGTLLGDAHIRRAGADKAYVTFEQSSKKLEYIKYLNDTAKKNGLGLISESLKEYTRTDSRYNKTNSSLYFKSQNLESLKPLAELFLNESGKKQIPSNIAEYLTPRSLAFWIMDDGQRVKRGGVTLCTDSFKSEEITILREALKSNFGLDTSIHYKLSAKTGATYERIYINKTEAFNDLKPYLIPHLHDSMLYKINE